MNGAEQGENSRRARLPRPSPTYHARAREAARDPKLKGSELGRWLDSASVPDVADWVWAYAVELETAARRTALRAELERLIRDYSRAGPVTSDMVVDKLNELLACADVHQSAELIRRTLPSD